MRIKVTRQPVGALGKLNRVLAAMHQPTVVSLPTLESAVFHRGASAVRRLLAPPLRRSTILMWSSFFFLMGSYYFVFNWTPKLLTAGGLTAQQGINSGVLLSLGGIAGTVVFAFVARVIHVRAVTLACLLVSAVLMVGFALSVAHLSIAMLVGVGLGAMSTSAMAGMYAFTPQLYAAELRTAGMGWSIGMGRMGAIVAPLATGVLVDHRRQLIPLYCLFAALLLLAMLALFGTSKSAVSGVS